MLDDRPVDHHLPGAGLRLAHDDTAAPPSIIGFAKRQVSAVSQLEEVDIDVIRRLGGKIEDQHVRSGRDIEGLGPIVVRTQPAG